VDQITVDDAHNVVSTAAYMCAKDIADADAGISALVKEVLRRAAPQA
jgi:enhancing lycopene biosynthesis protein 2